MEKNKIAKIVINIQGKEVSFTEEELRILQSSINKLLGNNSGWYVYPNTTGTITTPYTTTVASDYGNSSYGSITTTTN